MSLWGLNELDFDESSSDDSDGDNDGDSFIVNSFCRKKDGEDDDESHYEYSV